MTGCVFYLRLPCKVHVIGFKLDTRQQLKRKSLCCVGLLRLCALFLPELTVMIKMYVVSRNWATGVCINFISSTLSAIRCRSLQVPDYFVLKCTV
jgi:hypothetical protein